MIVETESKKSYVYSSPAHRRVIGILGVGLPPILLIGGVIIFNIGLQISISHYYYTGMRGVLVGTLWVIGFFLLSYKGYERKDDFAGNLACLFAVGVALFPTEPDIIIQDISRIIGYLHYFFAFMFFSTLIYFSLCLFTKTDPKKSPTTRKRHRNKVYIICGLIMCVCILLIALFLWLPHSVTSSLEGYKPVFWLEAVAIWAFGISWFTKGEGMLKDRV